MAIRCKRAVAIFKSVAISPPISVDSGPCSRRAICATSIIVAGRLAEDGIGGGSSSERPEGLIAPGPTTLTIYFLQPPAIGVLMPFMGFAVILPDFLPNFAMFISPLMESLRLPDALLTAESPSFAAAPASARTCDESAPELQEGSLSVPFQSCSGFRRF